MIIPPEVINSHGELKEDYNNPMTEETRDEDLGFAKHDVNENYDLETEKKIDHRQIDRCFSADSDYMRKRKGNSNITNDAIAPQSFDGVVKVMQDQSKLETGSVLWKDKNKAANFDDRQVKKRPDAAYMPCSNGRPQHNVKSFSRNNEPETTFGEMKSALPEQTVVALSENLPWDPEEAFTVSTHSTNTDLRDRAVASFEIPKVREQLVPDVKRSWEKASDSYNSSHTSQNSVQVNRLSPSMAEIGRNSYTLGVNEGSRNLAFDRRKQRTMRRINWETNYIPPLDCQPKPISPMIKRAVLRPVRKETSV